MPRSVLLIPWTVRISSILSQAVNLRRVSRRRKSLLQHPKNSRHIDKSNDGIIFSYAAKSAQQVKAIPKLASYLREVKLQSSQFQKPQKYTISLGSTCALKGQYLCDSRSNALTSILSRIHNVDMQAATQPPTIHDRCAYNATYYACGYWCAVLIRIIHADSDDARCKQSRSVPMMLMQMIKVNLAIISSDHLLSVLHTI
ncbi:unnamed protein product [Albugo candida]|uniref:Uncharacterized protein n=1 Tax=Albugo candida TaxID=65357 RepID=A0A024G6C2_9STRA|nr:unnamed protein product [Albugo candida]|eukprot:CCI42114.1 unnamed protein product [Albugo candida]